MTDQPKKHVVRRVVQAVCKTPWLIHEQTMESICELLELRGNGYGFTEQEIQARIGVQPQEPLGMQNIGGVAVIPIHGVMGPKMNMLMQVSGGTSTQAVGKMLRSAMDDPDVNAIVLDIDSPGGTVAGTQELAELVALAKSKKPVKAVATSMAASAAYWVATQASEFIVNPSAQIGSIGVYSVYTDTSRQDENAGVEHTVIRSAPNKAKPSGYEALDDKARELMQESVNDAHSQFVAAVAAGRGVSTQYVESNFGGGRTFMGAKAVALGMADRVGTLDEVVSQLANSGGVPTRPITKSGGMKMSTKLREAVVARGLCKADASDEEFLKAMEKYAETEAVITGKDSTHSTAVVAGADPADVFAAVKMASLPDGFDRMALAEAFVKEKLDLRAINSRLSDEVAKHNKPAGPSAPVDPGAGVRVVGDARDSLRAAARDALMIRANGGTWDAKIGQARDAFLMDQGRDKECLGDKPAQGAIRDRRLQSAMGLAEICLRADGYSDSLLSRLSKPQIAQLALGIQNLESFGIYASDSPLYNVSGMFASVMLDVSNNSLRKGYTEGRSTYDQWMKRGESLPDFRKKYQTLLGELADPQAIPENGEFPETSVQDEHESYRLEVWGSRFGISWQAMVNDNIGAFTDTPAKMGRSVRRKQNRLAYQVLKDNPTMTDTGALFNSTAQSTAGGHANLTTGAGAPSETTLNALELKMLQMIGPTGTANGDAQALNIQPRYIIVPPALKRTVQKLLASDSDATTQVNAGVVNTWKGQLQMIFDAELGLAFGGSDTAWYLATDPNDVDTIEYAFLQGLESPVIEQQNSFNTIGRMYRVYQPFGVAPIDYRGLQKHAGA